MGRSSVDSHGLWELAVLCCLREEAMHPYEIQRVLRARAKDQVLDLKRGSLYHAIARLERAGRIEAVKTERQGRRPERTTYRITADGRQELVRWLREMIASPRPEPSEFMGAVSFLIFLPPAEAADQLERRAARLGEEIEELGQSMRAAMALATRVNLLESEYLVAIRRAELRWVRALAAELRGGTLSWDLDTILGYARAARRKAERR